MSDASLYTIYRWVEKSGPVGSIDRFRLKLLLHTMREALNFDNLGPQTRVSESYIKAALEAATAVVGKPFQQ